MGARLLLILLLSGCASDRYLTKDQDDEMRRSCEPEGCAIVPNPLWKQIEYLLGVIREI